MTFASGGNHGIFIFAKFFVRCGQWRRKEHVRGKRSSRPRPTHSPGLFSPLLFGISLIFWNIFGVYASTGVTTMNNSSNNSTHSMSKSRYTTNSDIGLQSPSTTLPTTEQSCEKNNKTCRSKSPQDVGPSTSSPPCDNVDVTVCNRNHTDYRIRLRRACEDYTCQYNDGYCDAHNCLVLPPKECGKCLCASRDTDVKTHYYFTKFKEILSRVDCKKPYSMWNCTHCSAVYKNWLCAVHGLYGNSDNDTDKPCLGMCTSVMSHCPYLVPHKLYGGSPSFQCPKLSDLSSNDSYAREGKCFVCVEPESRNYNDSMECVLNYTMATSGSKRITTKFVLLIWLVFMMRISVYFNTASYL